MSEVAVEERACRDCGSKFPRTSEFFPVASDYADGLALVCRPCRNGYKKDWKKRTPEKQKASYTRRMKNGSALKHQRKYLLRKKYGMTPERYVEELQKQGGRCAICRRLPEEGALKFSSSGAHLSIDHDHKTKEFRGLLCGACNAGLGHLRDDVEALKRALVYLEGGGSKAFERDRERV